MHCQLILLNWHLREFDGVPIDGHAHQSHLFIWTNLNEGCLYYKLN